MMRHLKTVSKRPETAASAICNNVTNNYQALLCFMMELLTGFFLPLADTKDPGDQTTE